MKGHSHVSKPPRPTIGLVHPHDTSRAVHWSKLPFHAACACVQDLALLTMPQPEGNLQPGVEENVPGMIATANTITRHGGMMHPAKRDRRRIVVDMREFGSPLPCVLHQQTMDIVPRTLEVCPCLSQCCMHSLPCVLHQQTMDIVPRIVEV